MRRTDTMSLTLGLVFLLLAAVGGWAAFGTVSWKALGIALPIALVVIGVLSLGIGTRK